MHGDRCEEVLMPDVTVIAPAAAMPTDRLALCATAPRGAANCELSGMSYCVMPNCMAEE